MYKITSFISILFGFSIGLMAQDKSSNTDDLYVPGVVIVKLKNQDAQFFNSDRKSSFSVFEAVKDIVSVFPKTRKLEYELKGESSNHVDLSLIYALSIDVNLKTESVIQELMVIDVFEYVERKKVNFVSFTPNDPKLSTQNYFSQINAFAAWDISQGNTNVKIGIVDTGTDMDHPDLQSEMTENLGDPINGIDDDNDGYIDNFNGWDFVDNDENPQVGSNVHGIHVAGIAAAATNNNKGVASVGFKTQFMPIRVGDGSAIIYGYEGIVYAADMGCDIINCSWGSFGFSAFGEDIINYATFNKGALVVCAAGNNGRDQLYYPAAFENSMAVSSVNSSDVKSTFSNYGYWVDITAPGENIYSTVNDGNYNANTGTSMSAPVVSGAAALVKAVYPQLAPKQIIEQLRNKSTNIDGLNPTVANKIGKGRLNIGNAISGTLTTASVVFGNRKITNSTDDVFKVGDSLFISGTFTNYLSTSQNVVVSVSTTSNYILANHTVENIGVMSSLIQVDNYATPFSFKIDPITPINSVVDFKINITDGVFTNTYYLEVLVNVDYLNIAINEMATTIGSLGQFGYNSRNQTQGLGVTYKGKSSQLFEGGLMIGTDNNNFVRVLDRVRSSGNSWDNDFLSVEKVKEVTPAPKGQYYVKGILNDSNALADSVGLDVMYSSYASTDIGHENYIVMEYKVVNTTLNEIKNVSIGLFADFDVFNYGKNACYTDLKRFYTYTQSTESGSHPMFAVQLLSIENFRSYCMDNINGGNGGVDIIRGFNTAKKYTTLTTNRYGAGFKDVSGNDVIQVTTAGGFDILPNDTVTVAFALMAAENKPLLDQVADSAYMRYNGVLPNSINEIGLNEIELIIFPNPAKDEVTIKLNGGYVAGTWSVKVVDILGRTVFSKKAIVGNLYKIDLSNILSGAYLVEIQVEGSLIETKFIKNSY